MSAQTNGTGDRYTREQHLEERLLEMEQQGFWSRLFRRGAQPPLSADTMDELLSTGLEAQLAERVGRLYEECVSRKYSHERRSNLFGRMAILFGLPIAIFAAVSGTAAFATLGQQVGTSWRLLVVVLSLAITVLSTIQTYFRFSERAIKEQDAANRFSSIQWEIRRWANTTQDRDRASVDSFVNDVLSEMEEADARYRGVEPKRRAVEKIAADTTPPQVLMVNPLDLAVDVPPDIRPTAFFSKDMDRASISHHINASFFPLPTGAFAHKVTKL